MDHKSDPISILESCFEKIGSWLYAAQGGNFECKKTEIKPSIYAFVLRDEKEHASIYYVGKAAKGTAVRMAGHKAGMRPEKGSKGGIEASNEIREWISKNGTVEIWHREFDPENFLGPSGSLDDEETYFIQRLNPKRNKNKRKKQSDNKLVSFRVVDFRHARGEKPDFD